MTGWQARQLAEQTGRTFVITGANSGVGLEAARDLVGRGAHVVLACRDVAAGETARAAITADARGTAEVRELDLADLESVALFAKELAEQLTREDRLLNGLVCNAGVMGGPYLTTAQGFERQMGTNHLGHVALVTALWPSLHAAGGRVVVLSSIRARAGRLSATSARDDLLAPPSSYDSGQVYANTKQANLLFVQELHRRIVAAGSPVSAVAAHPGVSWTNLFPRQMQEQGKGWLVPFVRVANPLLFQTAAAGALPTLRALDKSTPSGSFVGPKAFLQWRGKPELLDVYATATDPATAARVWQLTEDVLGTTLPL